MWNHIHSNQICFHIEFLQNQLIFQNKIKNIKPTLCIKPPYSFSPKNWYLFDKLNQKNNKRNYNKYVNEKYFKNNNIRPKSSFPGTRKNQFRHYINYNEWKIEEDNKKISEKILKAKSYYSNEEMRKHSEKHQRYRNFMIGALKKKRATPIFNDEIINILN